MYNTSLSRARIARGLRLSDVAKQLGVTHSLYRNWEAMASCPGLEKYEELKKFFGEDAVKDFLIDPNEDPETWRQYLALADVVEYNTGRPRLLRDHRIRHSLSQQQLADAFNVNRITWIRWEAGDAQPKPPHANLIVSLFGNTDWRVE